MLICKNTHTREEMGGRLLEHKSCHKYYCMGVQSVSAVKHMAKQNTSQSFDSIRTQQKILENSDLQI